MTTNACIKGRRSIRMFKDQAISHDVLSAVIETASYLEITEDSELVALIPIGYPDEAPVAPRRKPVEELLLFK